MRKPASSLCILLVSDREEVKDDLTMGVYKKSGCGSGLMKELGNFDSAIWRGF